MTDKHVQGFTPVYQAIAEGIGPQGDVLEIGVADGESLALWLSWFPFGTVTGVDCNPGATWPDGARRIVCDQADPRLIEDHLGPYWYDLIVDDGCHKGPATRAAFERLWPWLRPGGWYVIEDWYVGTEEYRDDPWYDPSMLAFAQELLLKIGRTADVEEIRYRYGLVIIRKAMPSSD